MFSVETLGHFGQCLETKDSHLSRFLDISSSNDCFVLSIRSTVYVILFMWVGWGGGLTGIIE